MHPSIKNQATHVAIKYKENRLYGQDVMGKAEKQRDSQSSVLFAERKSSEQTDAVVGG